MSLIYIIFLFSSQPLKVWSLNGKKIIIFCQKLHKYWMSTLICCHCIDNSGKCYFNWIPLLFWANESIISDTVKSISLWINNKASPCNVSFVIVLLSHILILLRDENDFSHSPVAIGKFPSSFKTKYIFGKAKTSTLFKVAVKNQGGHFYTLFYPKSYTRGLTLQQGQ